MCFHREELIPITVIYEKKKECNFTNSIRDGLTAMAEQSILAVQTSSAGSGTLVQEPANCVAKYR